MAGTSVAENLASVLRRIEETAKKCGRDPSAIELVAVTKTKPVEMIDEASREAERLFGVSQTRVSFGENYTQEAVLKISARPAYKWNFIGSLQSNKVNEIVGRVSVIHSVDRLKIAKEISKAAVAKNIVQNILLELNIGDEATKHGFSRFEIANSFLEILELKGVAIAGLMALPPPSDNEKISRAHFRSVRETMTELRDRFLNSDQAGTFNILSMGTTGDFEAAILEGATHVRVGTAIFGERESRTK